MGIELVFEHLGFAFGAKGFSFAGFDGPLNVGLGGAHGEGAAGEEHFGWAWCVERDNAAGEGTVDDGR